jgi:hypothetical protein
MQHHKGKNDFSKDLKIEIIIIPGIGYIDK